MLHWALLHDKAADRWHPIIFRPSPRPSDDVDEGKYCRHRSSGHHTQGFPSKAEAVASMAEEQIFATGIVLAWDGQGIPATTLELPYGRAIAPETSASPAP
ncbi:hypothetical protein LAZ40_00945 [Cereibacter sphaeroides]|uniref:hypothetical protein n=1 Tax=Cereibacter sphaeroides TaxID=1063 RepID=UPI001F1CE23E|nr:hypothetical protein [Cereibacter sphaeroides]MCE6957637.1 hypothetical protein [Cereibacter sphaeroides]MCE6971227.1 hypothetical protein [Cereibacter sphaeroides]